MSELKDNDEKKLSLGGSRTLSLNKKAMETGQVRQSFSHGRSKPVLVERKRKRLVEPGHVPEPAKTAGPAAEPAAADHAPEPATSETPVDARPQPAALPAEPTTPADEPAALTADRRVRSDMGLPRIIDTPAPVVRPKILGEAPPRPPRPAAPPAPPPVEKTAERPAPRPAVAPKPGPRSSTKGRVVLRTLTDEEKASRARALEGARVQEERARQLAEIEAKRRVVEEARAAEEREAAARRQKDEDERHQREEESRRKAEAEAARRLDTDGQDNRSGAAANTPGAEQPRTFAHRALPRVLEDENDESKNRAGAAKKVGAKVPRQVPATKTRTDDRRRSGKISLTASLDGEERQHSVASMRRRIEREKRQMRRHDEPKVKVVRDVIIPEAITVQELANRMAERGADVIKHLMRLGVMATINQAIDADTAELIATEFGHRTKRVAESDIEIGLAGEDDLEEHLEPRAPVVTVMGHVDHGKTSLLDALRKTDVAAGEAGGITQHIGAYQVALGSGQKITFLDTPGHEAFTAMRARGAQATDIVVLVVAADDGIMPQTIEAIRHAKAASVPIVVAINKIDKHDANPDRVRNELLQHDIVVEDMGGDVQAIEVSAKIGTGLDKLEEAILLQAEILELKANPNRMAAGVVIEAKLDRGRGPVATVLVQRGTLRVGDIFVAGSEWGRVRALVDDHGNNRDAAEPSVPVEVLGLSGTPAAGDEFQTVENEARAREVTAFRQRRAKDQRSVGVARASLEQMFSKIREGEVKELPIVVKGDVQGSVEAIIGSLNKMGTNEVAVRIVHDAVGGVTESDVTLARASNAPIIAFNVRANKQARDLAEQEGVELRYYSVIYDLVDDIRQALSGLLAPTLKETFLGNAEIREVFNITKVGKVAGCLVTEGQVRRGAKVRLIRDNVVIHEGTLSTLKRFKDEVKEVRAGTECGMAFENYHDLQVRDVIECFDVEQVARTL